MTDHSLVTKPKHGIIFLFLRVFISKGMHFKHTCAFPLVNLPFVARFSARNILTVSKKKFFPYSLYKVQAPRNTNKEIKRSF